MQRLSFPCFFLFALFVSCNPGEVTKENKYLEKIIENQMNAGGGNFAAIGQPAWTKVCFLGPYTGGSTASEVLGFSWNIESYSKISMYDDITLIVFATDRKVVDFVEYPRNKHDFSGFSRKCYERSKAIMKIPE